MKCPHELYLFKGTGADGCFGQWSPCTQEDLHPPTHVTADGFHWSTGETGIYRRLPKGELLMALDDPAIKVLQFRDVVRGN